MLFRSFIGKVICFVNTDPDVLLSHIWVALNCVYGSI